MDCFVRMLIYDWSHFLKTVPVIFFGAQIKVIIGIEIIVFILIFITLLFLEI
jgi:hypothetical protein